MAHAGPTSEQTIDLARELSSDRTATNYHVTLAVWQWQFVSFLWLPRESIPLA